MSSTRTTPFISTAGKRGHLSDYSKSSVPARDKQPAVASDIFLDDDDNNDDEPVAPWGPSGSKRPAEAKKPAPKRVVADDDDEESSDDDSFIAHDSSDESSSSSSADDSDSDAIMKAAAELVARRKAKKQEKKNKDRHRSASPSPSPVRRASDKKKSSSSSSSAKPKQGRRLSARDEEMLAREEARRLGFDMEKFDDESDVEADDCDDDDKDGSGSDGDSEYEKYLKHQRRLDGADDLDDKDLEIVRGDDERLIEALDGLIAVSDRAVAKVVEREMAGRKFDTLRQRQEARMQLTADTLASEFGVTKPAPKLPGERDDDGDDDDDEDGGAAEPDPVECDAYKLVKPMLGLLEKEYNDLPEKLAAMCRYVMGGTMTACATGGALMSTDAPLNVDKTDFHHLRLALFNKMVHRTKNRLCAQFIATVYHMLNASAVYELRAIRPEINPGDPRSANPYVCVICDDQVQDQPVPGKALARCVTAVEVSQHKSSTLKNKIKVISAAPSTAQGSLGQSCFIMCDKCIPCIKLFNQVILAERHVQWLSQHFLKHQMADVAAADPKAIINAFHQWDIRIRWATSVAVSFKLLHAVLID